MRFHSKLIFPLGLNIIRNKDPIIVILYLSINKVNFDSLIENNLANWYEYISGLKHIENIYDSGTF